MVFLASSVAMLEQFAAAAMAARLLNVASHLIVVVDHIGKDQIKNIMRKSWTYSMMNTVVVEIEDKETSGE